MLEDSTEKQDEPLETDEVSRTEIEAFFRDTKYSERWLAHKRRDTTLAGFNFWAAYFGTAWFCYRRLYWQGVAALVLEVLIPSVFGIVALIIFNADHAINKFGLAVSSSFVGIRVAMGFWGNLALFEKAERDIREIDEMNFDNDMHLLMISGAGAVNFPLFFVAFAILGVVDRLSWYRLI